MPSAPQKTAAPEESLKDRFQRTAARVKAQATGQPVTLGMLNQIRMRKRWTEEAFGGELYVAKRTLRDTWNLYMSTATENADIFDRSERLLACDLPLKELLKRLEEAPGGGMTYNAQKYNHPARVMKMTP